MLEAFKNKVHIGCDRFSLLEADEGKGVYRLPRRCSPAV